MRACLNICIHLFLLAFSLALRAQDSVITLAGQAQVPGVVNGTGTNALFNEPAGVAVDASGKIYVADSGNNAIRVMTANGVVSTFAGQLGVAGTLNGTGTNAQFYAPSGLAFDASGNLLVADTGNGTLRKISPDGSVSTFAGVAGQTGYLDGAATSALFGAPIGLAVATNGNVYVADAGNHVIRLVSAGIVSTFAGTATIWGTANGQGTNAQFNAPCGLALDAHGNLLVSDSNNHTIRKITPAGLVTTFAGQPTVDGSANGPAATATFCHPAEIVFDRQGNLLIADSFNEILREVSTNGMVSTISGTARIAGGADGLNGQGRYFNPYGLVFQADGSLLVADAYNESLRKTLVPFKLTLQPASVSPTFTLSWESVVGCHYQIQYADNLSGGWTNLTGPITATGFALSQTDSPPQSQAQRHYRVLLVP